MEQSENFNMIKFILTPAIYIPILMFACLMIIFILKKNYLMIKIKENALLNNLSPYLKQHKDNPVNWQIWSREILEFSKKK